MTSSNKRELVYEKGDKMPLEDRLRIKRRLEKVLSEALSAQFDCKITIKFKPEPDELESAGGPS